MPVLDMLGAANPLLVLLLARMRVFLRGILLQLLLLLLVLLLLVGVRILSLHFAALYITIYHLKWQPNRCRMNCTVELNTSRSLSLWFASSLDILSIYTFISWSLLKIAETKYTQNRKHPSLRPFLSTQLSKRHCLIYDSDLASVPRFSYVMDFYILRLIFFYVWLSPVYFMAGRHSSNFLFSSNLDINRIRDLWGRDDHYQPSFFIFISILCAPVRHFQLFLALKYISLRHTDTHSHIHAHMQPQIHPYRRTRRASTVAGSFLFFTDLLINIFLVFQWETVWDWCIGHRLNYFHGTAGHCTALLGADPCEDQSGQCRCTDYSHWDSGRYFRFAFFSI